jgi:hypothetical protein
LFLSRVYLLVSLDAPIPACPSHPTQEGGFSINPVLLDQKNFCTLQGTLLEATKCTEESPSRARTRLAERTHLGNAAATGEGDDLTWKD